MIKSILYLLITILIIVIIVIKVRHHFKKIEKFAYGNYGIQCYYDKPFRISDNSILGQQSGDYHYLRFIYNGSGDERIYTLNLYADVLCDILIVGGGASGASAHGGIVGGSPNRGGGGGGGGVVYIINRILNAGTYKINVGRGGLPSSKDGKDSNIKNSDNSQVIIDGIELIGKGGGKPIGNLGGAGGGRDGGFQGLTFWDGEGYDYGGYNRSGGNGGGAGSSSGIGRDVNITNQIVHYGAGGKQGSGVRVAGNNGDANTGEGGGGAVGEISSSQMYNGGAGGSGIVIVRFIMKENGVVYSCGNNDKGQLGLGTFGADSNESSPTLIDKYYNSNLEAITYNLINITKILTGGFHSLFLTSEGHVYSCGYNQSGQLGFDSGKIQDDNDITDGREWDIENNPCHIRHTLIEKYYNSDIEAITYTNIRIAEISAGYNHSLFLTSEGRVYSCGYNELGQLGLNSRTTTKTPTLIEKYYNSDIEAITYTNIRITKISSGFDHSLFLTSEGYVYSCGWNWYGQLGLGTDGWDVASVNKPTLIEKYYNSDIEAITYTNIRITEISCGGDHSLFLTSNKHVYSCGWNSFGTLGLGNQYIRTRPALIDTYYNSEEEQITYDLIKITKISSGMQNSLFLTEEGYVYSCGSNWNGQLGLGTGGEGTIETSARLIRKYYTTSGISHNYNTINITKISSGFDYSLFLTSDGQVYSCGGNYWGQLGLGTNGEGNDKYSPTLIETYYSNNGKRHNYSNIRIAEISAGWNHSLFLYNYKN